MNKFLIGIGLAAAIMTATPAAAQVYVNGKRLNAQEVARLADYSCGPIFPGSYWINPATGQWGFAGSRRVMGHLKDRCGPRSVFKDGNMSREGRLFYPGELLR